MSEKLDAGARFPAMSLSLAGDGTLALPDAIKTAYQVVLFYRGHW